MTYFFTTHTQFDIIHSQANMMSNGLPHFIWTIGVCCDTRNEISVSSRYFFTIGEIPRAGDVACVDGITDHDIASLIC